MKIIGFFLGYLVCSISLHLTLAFNPYAVLGVQKTASVPEIKRAFKNLARKLHPDKNTDKGAEGKFIELNKAYDLLMDPERRRRYDKTGQTEDSPNFRHRPDYSGFNSFDFDHFDSFTGRQAHKYSFHTANYFRKHTITYRAYENNIFPQSFTRPFIIVFYGDLCIPCVKIEQLLQKVMSELESIGVGFATVHSQHEAVLARKIGVRSLPYIMSLTDGDIRPFREEEVSLSTLIDFVRHSLPNNLVTEVTDQNYVDFLSGWRDNKVRVLFVNADHSIKLRYSLVAFYFRERIAFGRVVVDKSSVEIRQRYHIDSKMNSMLIFNEDLSRTTATLSVSELKTQLMKDVLESNKYLFLPRIASQTMFDQLCPIGSLPSRVKLCVMLVSSDASDNEPKLEAMRNFIKENEYSKERFRFMYIYREKQPEFVKSLSEGFHKGNIHRGVHVVVLWRRESDHVFYEWLDNEWDLIDLTYVNETKQKLGAMLGRLSKNAAQFPHRAKITTLVDESAKSLISRIVKRLLLVTENISDNIARTDPMPIVSVILTVIIIVFIGYFMTHFMKIEEESIREKYNKLGRQMPGSTRPRSERCSTNTNKLNIHELRGETYNGLIRLLKPGCRTIVLLCDSSSKCKLLPQFYKAVYPYRKNKTLMFAFFLVEKNIEWYKKVLLQTLGDDRDLNINPKNCIGTVISINGFRKYFCVYHAKHPELTVKHKRRNGEENGEFLGLNDESDISDRGSDVECGMLVDGRTNGQCMLGQDLFEDEVIFENHLLDGLPNWLDRLFEGTTTRYYINYWPEHMK